MSNANMKLSGNRCQCPTCGQFFNSVSVFDRHRVGSFDDPANPRRCLTTRQMLAKGFAQNGKGYWVRHRRKAGTIRRQRATEGHPGTTVVPLAA